MGVLRIPIICTSFMSVYIFIQYAFNSFIQILIKNTSNYSRNTKESNDINYTITIQCHLQVFQSLWPFVAVQGNVQSLEDL